jgi:hypothetical protein
MFGYDKNRIVKRGELDLFQSGRKKKYDLNLPENYNAQKV